MFLAPNTAQRPMFPVRSRLSIVRDIAVVAVCIGIVLGFLLEIWSPATPRRPVTPASTPAALLASV